MDRQSTRAKLFAVSLFSLSAVGTLALFNAVPVIARMLSAQPVVPPEAQVFPQQPVKLSQVAKPD